MQGQAGAAVRPPVIGGHGAESVFREGRAHPCQGIRFADASHERSEPRQRWLQGCLWLGDVSRPQPQRFRSYFADPCGGFKIVA